MELTIKRGDIYYAELNPVIGSDCDWTGVSLSSLWVMAKSGAVRYFE